jgi:teichuronic acid exporter
MTKKNKSKSFLDLFWSFTDNILQQVFNFIVGIILARILMPEEFGLLGILTVFMTLSNVFVDGGFSAALINKKDTTEEDYNTVFYTNIVISILIYILIFFTSRYIAVFFNNPEIEGLLKIIGLNVLLVSFSVIHRTMVVKSLNFRILTLVSLISVFISAACAIYMAYNGFGVYSLVYRLIIGEAMTVILFWILNKWRPKFIFSKKSFNELFNYGVNLFLSNLLNKLHTNIYFILIAKYFSPIQLGYYTRANSFNELASINISSTINRVSFSTLSKNDDKLDRFNKFIFFQNVNYLLTSISMAMLFFASKEIILLLLSNKWERSIYIMKILSLSGIFISLYSFNLNYLAVLRCTKKYLRIEILGKILIVPIVFFGVVLGFNMFLYLIVIHSVIMYLIVLYTVNKIENGRLKSLLY